MSELRSRSRSAHHSSASGTSSTQASASASASSSTAASASASGSRSNQRRDTSGSNPKETSQTVESQHGAEIRTASPAPGEMREWRRSTPLPAVKGTIGGIESPRRGHFASSSISTIRDLPSPTTPRQNENGGSSTPHSDQPPQPQYIRNSDAPVFRSDTTVKTTFDYLNLDAKDELKRLFIV